MSVLVGLYYYIRQQFQRDSIGIMLYFKMLVSLCLIKCNCPLIILIYLLALREMPPTVDATSSSTLG